jgi:hypothetical protein
VRWGAKGATDMRILGSEQRAKGNEQWAGSCRGIVSTLWRYGWCREESTLVSQQTVSEGREYVSR